MRTLRSPALALGLSLACHGGAAVDTGPTYDPDPSDTLSEDSRPAPVVLPEDYRIDQSYPLVVLLHGYGVNATAQDLLFGLTARAQAGELILVLPDGTLNSDGRRFWNASTACCDFEGTGVDDVAYVSGLIEEAKQLYPISHVAIVGHSNGGYMAYRMACERPDLMDRIAPLAGVVSSVAGECPATDAVRVLHMHGTDDGTIPYADGTFGSMTHLGAESSLALWTSLGGCSAPTPTANRDHLDGVEGAETEVLVYDCPDGDMQLWRGVGGDHLYLSANASYRDDLAAWLLAP